MRPFFTIGHSTRSIDTFVALIDKAGIRLVVDVRTIPRSRTNPQYNSGIFAGTLSDAGIAYEHMAALGGLRARQQEVPEAVNGFWQNRSFHNYADYALSEPFRAGLARLRDLGHAKQCAIMCAEAVWWRCHRRIIADYLIMAGESVFHIIGDRVERAQKTAAARPLADGTILYPHAD